mmetsp:Transcript_29648/g.43767  ORF Transcript_29648/g.43767 Transcript_29648/m.43767 type:complete len:782 (+) Transcript_29648:77-2422(+)
MALSFPITTTSTQQRMKATVAKAQRCCFGIRHVLTIKRPWHEVKNCCIRSSLLSWITLRLRNALIRIATAGTWDYLYLMAGLVTTILLPCFFDGYTKVIYPAYALLIMGIIPVIPIVMAVFIRAFLLTHLRSISSDETIRFWNLFFFGAINVINFRSNEKMSSSIQIRQIFVQLLSPCRKSNHNIELGEKKEDDEISQGSNSSIHCNESSLDSCRGDDDSYVEFEINENEVAWSCVTCNEFNLEQKVPKSSKSEIEQRKGTKENASLLRIIPRQLGNMENEYVAEFRRMKDSGNKCCNCGTPFNYKPRRSLQKYFYPLRDYSLDAKKKEFYEERQRLVESVTKNENEMNNSPSLPSSPLCRSFVDEVGLPTAMELTSNGIEISSISRLSSKQKYMVYILKKWTAKFALLIGSVPRCVSRFHNHLVERQEPQENERYLHYNDNEKKEKLKAFFTSTSVSFERIEQNEDEERKEDKYDEGEDIEAVVESGARHQNTWYPGKIIRATLLDENGTYYYDILYQNGELADCVPANQIRRRISYGISPLLRLMMCMILMCLTLCPLSIAMPLLGKDFFGASYNENDVTTMFDKEANSKNKFHSFKGFFLPCEDALKIILVSSVIIATGLLYAHICSYLKMARIGVFRHAKLFLFSSLPSWTLIATILQIRRAIAATVLITASNDTVHQENNPVHQEVGLWRKSLISSTLFSITSILHLFLMSPFWGLAGIAVTIPLWIFQILNGLSLDGAVVFSSHFIVYAPLQFMVVLLVVVRLFTPYIRKSYLYV